MSPRKAARSPVPKSDNAAVPSPEVMPAHPAGPPPQPAEAVNPAEVEFAEDVAMPTVENDPASIFQPKPGCKILDVYEITLMYLLELTNSHINVAPGALRGVQLSADRVHQLSDSARQHMQTVSAPQGPAVGEGPPPPGGVQ